LYEDVRFLSDARKNFMKTGMQIIKDRIGVVLKPEKGI
jgi:hypothetical protein